MGKSKTEQTQQTQQQFDQTQNQTTEQQQRQLQLQEQVSSNLQNFLKDYTNQQSQTQQQQQQQATQGTTTQGLSAFQQPVVSQFFNDLMKQYTSGSLTPQVYMGERVAGVTPQELQSRQLATNYAQGAGTNYANQALATGQHLLDPNVMLNPANIPGFQASKDAMMQQLTRNLTENQLPAVRGQYLTGGGYGGSRQGIAEGLATARTNEAIANTGAQMDMQAYSQGLQAMQNALGMAPQTAQVGMQPAQIMGQVGAQQRGDQQLQLDAQRQQFQEQQAQPANTLALLQSLMGTQGQYGGTTTQAGTQTGATTGTATGQTTGQESGTQFAQQLASMMGLNLADLTGQQTGTTSGTSSGTTTQQSTKNPSTIQQLGALASIFMLPFTMGGSAQGFTTA